MFCDQCPNRLAEYPECAGQSETQKLRNLESDESVNFEHTGVGTTLPYETAYQSALISVQLTEDFAVS